MKKRTKEDSLRVQLALSQIYERHQKITPSLVVEAAKDKASPLHKQFEWSDTEAARKYRLHQARTLIRSVEVRVNVGTVSVAAPAYVRSPRVAANEQGYVSTQRLAGDTEAAKQTLLYEARRARGQMERAERLAKVLGMEAELAQVLDALTVVERRLVA